MAGGDQDRQAIRQEGRLGPGITKASSRVSKAAGGQDGQSGQEAKNVKAEQRSNIPAKSRTRGTASSRQGGSGSGSSNRKSPSPRRANPTPAASKGTIDTRFITWMRDTWNGLEPHHQRRVYSILLLVFGLLLFGMLTFFRSAFLLGGIADFFRAIFGWSAYVLAIGLIALAIARFTEDIRNQRYVRRSQIIGIILLGLVVLAESRLLLGSKIGGVLANLLVLPLLGWSPAVGHILFFGLFCVIAVVTFRITFGHVLMVSRAIKRLITSKPQSSSTSTNATGPSPYLGQRPRFSRYASGLGIPSPTPVPAPSNRKQPAQADIEDEEFDDEVIAFNADFDGDFEDDDEDDDDDPRNDINLHKQEISRVPRGPRSPQALNVGEYNQAVQGAQQQPLPFHKNKLVLPSPNEDPRTLVDKEMEPLPPNPLLAQRKQPIIIRRAEGQPAVESPWAIPSITLLNNPEEVKLQMLGDDTSTLAKIIQDTLRSFRVEAEVRPEDISIGPTVIRFGIRPTGKPEMKQDEKGKFVPVRDASGSIVYETRTRVSRIMALQNDLALVLEAKAIRMEAPVPGRPYVGVEIPNKNSRLVTLREVLESKEYQTARNKSKLAVALGKDVAGQVRVGDLARMPHLLIAGATGAGKCLAYNEPVFLADGRIVKVQELIGQTVQVIGVTNTQTMQQVPVPATFTENGVQDVFEIELDNGVILRRTGEHPLWTAGLNENQHVGRQSNGKAVRRTRAIHAGWVRARDVRVCGNRPHFDGHVILCPLNLQQQGKVSKSDADVILCAALLAEGSLNHYDYISYRRTPRFTNADPEMVELVAGAARQYDCKLVLSQSKSKGPFDYYISRNSLKGRDGNPISKLVHDWGITGLATHKTIPQWVFQLPDEQIALFLRVFIDCDGWFCARTEGTVSVNVSLANPILVRQLGQLAMRLGITGTYTHKENGHAGAWTWSSPMVALWQERIGSTVKTEKLACAVKELTKNRENAATEWTAWRRAQPLPDQKFTNCPEGYEWRKVVSVRRTTAPTINIEVHSENHAFVGYAVEHNSVCLNTLIASILTQASPDDVRLLLVDPKMVELNMYNGIPHLLSPVVIEVDKVVPLLRNAIAEMERRYRLFSQLGVRNLDGYRKMRAEKLAQNDPSLANLPAIVIIIDELADLMMAAPEEVEGMICRLAQLARATGIHLVIATQRPSVDVITGLIKANIPTRISFMVSSAVDSRTIIDMGGAERLLGRGDMLYLPADAGRPERIQCSFLTDEEAEQLVAAWKQQVIDHAAANGTPPNPIVVQSHVEPGWEIKEQSSDDFDLEDGLLDKAEEVVREYGRASISLLQRRLRIGYSRAARLIDLLEEHGIIGSMESGGRSREVFDDITDRHGNGNGHGGSDRSDGRTMADEVADIIAEEKARDEALKRQGAGRLPAQGQTQAQNDEEDEADWDEGKE